MIVFFLQKPEMNQAEALASPPSLLCAFYSLSVNRAPCICKYLEHRGAVQPQRAIHCTLIGLLVA